MGMTPRDMDKLQEETDKAFEEFKEKLEKKFKLLEGMSAWFTYCGYVSRKFKDLGEEFS